MQDAHPREAFLRCSLACFFLCRLKSLPKLMSRSLRVDAALWDSESEGCDKKGAACSGFRTRWHSPIRRSPWAEW